MVALIITLHSQGRLFKKNYRQIAHNLNIIYF